MQCDVDWTACSFSLMGAHFPEMHDAAGAVRQASPAELAGAPPPRLRPARWREAASIGRVWPPDSDAPQDLHSNHFSLFGLAGIRTDCCSLKWNGGKRGGGGGGGHSVSF